MTRDRAIREEVLELDGFRSQITGFDGRDIEERKLLAVHHDKRLGMGGVYSRDTIDNCITITVKEHSWLHSSPPVITIDKWDREAGILEVTDRKGVLLEEPGPVPREKLYFYRSRLKAELEQCVTAMQGVYQTDRARAFVLWRLWINDNYKEIEEATSFPAFAGSLGWPARRVDALATLYDEGRRGGVLWPAKMTATDYRRQLRNAGKLAVRDYWHVAFRDTPTLLRLITQEDLVLKRCTSDEFDEHVKPLAAIGLKVNSWFKLKADKGELSGPNGEVIPFERVGVRDDNG